MTSVRILLQEQAFKAPIKQAVTAVMNFKETHTFRDDLNRTFLVFSKPAQEFKRKIHPLKIKTKLNQNNAKFDKETIASVKMTSEPTLYIDCTNTSIKTAQDLSATLRRELDGTLKKSNLNRSVFSIRKVKTDKEKTVFQVEAYNHAQTFALINMNLEQRLLDKFGNSIVITDNLENLFKSGKNFIILDKTGKEKPDFYDNESKAMLGPLVAKTTFTKNRRLYLETFSFKASNTILQFMKTKKLFGTTWKYAGVTEALTHASPSVQTVSDCNMDETQNI
ncbi:hypothetical protein ROZALSC1DRAFT_24891 [Rozella allomycis CSF55]|uniref:Uncharacterized protein n=1 Tax=Rozella allomycis (strain CSF55) TaxID=988480 RepID=A0A4P9YBT1_ROZAC|nr:hypothetical protein ROZALSC1DRAFT_24891 [Rozella allomycis CSF55]